jgi:hypothetical protein
MLFCWSARLARAMRFFEIPILQRSGLSWSAIPFVFMFLRTALPATPLF